MRWQWKCLRDNCKALVPYGAHLRRHKYDLVPYRSQVPRADGALEEGVQQLEWLQQVRSIDGASVLEIGTGWEPIVPLLYVIAGARRVYLTDLNRLCSRHTTQGALEAIRRNRVKVLSRLQVSAERFDRATRWDPLAQTLDEGLAQLGMTYMAPCNCQHLNLDSGSVDIVSSRAVLEHIPAHSIFEIFSESYRLLKSGGLGCHFVDPSDHWQHGDPSITKINFLQFSDTMHNLVHFSPLNYHNRLRHPEYVAMLRRSGFEIVREEREVDERSLQALPHMKLATRFLGYSPLDLATTNTFVLARKPA